MKTGYNNEELSRLEDRTGINLHCVDFQKKGAMIMTESDVTSFEAALIAAEFTAKNTDYDYASHTHNSCGAGSTAIYFNER